MYIKEMMKKKGLTQVDLAERMGMNRVSVSRLLSEKNDMRTSTLEKIASAIGCNVADFFNPQCNVFLALVRDGGEWKEYTNKEELLSAINGE